MPLKLVSDTKNPKPVNPDGVEWHCQVCGGTVLVGTVAGARVRQGVLNLAADSVHVGEAWHCASCDTMAATRQAGQYHVLR